MSLLYGTTRPAPWNVEANLALSLFFMLAVLFSRLRLWLFASMVALFTHCFNFSITVATLLLRKGSTESNLLEK